MFIVGALISDADRPFLVVVVPAPVIADCDQAEQTFQYLRTRVAGMPIALVTRNEHGAPTAYYGPRELAIRLSHVPATSICWSNMPLV